MSSETISPESLATPSPKPAEIPVLSAHFEAIREPLDTSSPEFDSEIRPLFRNSQEFVQVLKDVTDAWKYEFSAKKMHQALLQPPNKQSYDYLKRVRKYCLILKTSFKFFDERQFAPQALQDLAKALGDLNDYYFSSEFEAKRQQLLARHLIEAVDQADLTLHPARPEVFRQHFRDVIDEIHYYLLQDTLTTKEFHGLRKKIRLLMNIFQIPAVRRQQGRERQVFQLLYQLSSSLGHEHDEVVQTHLHDQESYQAQQFQLDSTVKRQMMRAEALIEQMIFAGTEQDSSDPNQGLLRSA